MKGFGKIPTIKIAIVVFWAAMMILYFVREGKQHAVPLFAESLQDVELSPDDAWYGIYLIREGGKEQAKIGFSHSTRRKSASGYLLHEETRMKLSVQGDEKNVRTKTSAAVDANFRLISFDFELSSDLMKFRMNGNVRDDRLMLDIVTAGSTQSESIELKSDPFLPLNLTDRIIAAGLLPGRRYKMELFDPSSMALDTITIEILGKEEVVLGETTRSLHHLKMEFKGIPFDSWIDEKGNLIKETSGNMMTIREGKEYALKEGWGDKPGMDILSFAAAPALGTIEHPRKVKSLRIRLLEADLTSFPLEDGRQRKSGDALAIDLESLDGFQTYSIPYPGSGMEEHLKAEPMVQSDDQEIVDQARAIVRDTTDALEAARKIHDWVYETLDKKPIVNIPSAKDVLLIKRGDCNEHATLMTALCRAVGIPTKTLIGVVYNDGSFYYHAWNAVYVGRWIAVDATFGQFPADASHVKLLEGGLEKQVEIIRVMGTLKVEVLSYQ